MTILVVGIVIGAGIMKGIMPDDEDAKETFNKGIEHGRDLERCEAKMGVWREDKCWPRVFPIDIGK